MSRTRKLIRSIAAEPVLTIGRNTVNAIDSLLFHIWALKREHPTLEKPIIMVGCPRSGTSIAVELFATHPWVANRSEAGQVWDPDHYYDPNAHHHWGAEMVTEEGARRLHAKFEYYRQRSGRKRLVNKHPRNSVRIDYIRQIFPDAFFIHVIRDGRAVVNSIINKTQREPTRQRIPFGNFCKPPHWRQFLRDDPVEQAALQWREIVRYVLSRRHELGARYQEFKYEDMCSMPRETFASMFEFAGLPVSDEFLARIPKQLRNMNYKWKEQLSSEQIASIDAVQEELLEELGYDI